MWTQFMDMHSGGKNKINSYEYIFIEANEKEAEKIFKTKFKRNPHNVTCACCGPDFAVYEHDTLEEATDFLREYKSRSSNVGKMSLEDFIKSPEVLVMYAEETA